MKHLYPLSFLFLLQVLVSCNPSKSLTKKGVELETAGMYREAANYYYDALHYNNKNVKAQIGLKNTGQKVLNDYFDDFFKQYHTDKLKEAVYDYRAADKYFLDLKNMGVYLKWDDHYKEDYENALARYLEQQYNSGLELLKKNDFAGSETYFTEILSLDANYKDVKTLQQTAILEPLYEAGVNFMAEKKYVKAYDQFNAVCKYTCRYKDTETLKAEALDKATFTIGFFIDDKDVKDLALQRKFASYVSTEIARSKNPFIQMIDRENIEKLLNEQKLGMSGVVDEKKAASAGKLIGVQSAFFINVLQNTVTNNTPARYQRTGYEVYTIAAKGPNGEAILRKQVSPFSYNEYSASSSYTVSVEFKLVSTETGKILYNRTISDKATDEINYAIPTRNIKLNQIFPSQTDNFFGPGLNSFRNKFTARQELKDANEMSNDLIHKIAANVAYDILDVHRQMNN